MQKVIKGAELRKGKERARREVWIRERGNQMKRGEMEANDGGMKRIQAFYDAQVSFLSKTVSSHSPLTPSCPAPPGIHYVYP